MSENHQSTPPATPCDDFDWHTNTERPAGADKRLFTPGPLNTSPEVRGAMLRDLGSRDTEFIETVSYVRRSLLQLAGVTDTEFTTVPMQGSGTYVIESVLQTVSPRDGAKVLALCNGAYGRRVGQLCAEAGISCETVHQPEDAGFPPSVAEERLTSGGPYTAVAVVHCETSSGVLNPVEAIGALVRRLQPSAAYVVDAMSSFGAVPLDLAASQVDYLVSSANKCIEGVPGFGFAIARLSHLQGTKGHSRSVSLDLYDQWRCLELSGQFRFTPPTHALLACAAALRRLLAAGGVPAQAIRYRANNAVIKRRLSRLGFRPLVRDGHDCYVITSFLCPSGERRFSFDQLYQKLSERDMVIYPGKVTEADCFRVGNIGHLHVQDMDQLADALEAVLEEMGVSVPVKYDD